MLIQGDSLIVTGASHGIGRALALALARRGIHLALCARGDEALDSSRRDCRRAGARVSAVAGNAAHDEVCERLVEQAMELGRFKGFIHVAGVLAPGPYVWEHDADEAAQVWDASVGGALALMRAAVPELRRRGKGLAVFFGSGASQRHQIGIGLYSAAKAAEEFLAGQLSAEAPEITSVVYRPAVADTRMQSQARNATGGAASVLRPVFTNYLESRQLLTPEAAAQALLTALEQDWAELRGRVLSAREILRG
ncbi:MAG: SDR family NAD(P)-dependent oxidoreductase [Deltaproteobacteria bacterium]|nr:SDR family NAD(P)-dependent oxidoreductase [Deltaproteobacteria bacterium]